MRLLYPLMSLLVSSAAQGQTCAPLGVDAASTLTLATALQRSRDCRLGDLDGHQIKDKPTRLRAVLQATVEVGRPTLFWMINIISANLSIFTLQRDEGRIFPPMAWRVTSTLVGSLVLALSLVPLLCLLRNNNNSSNEDNRLVRACKWLHAPALAWVIERPRTVLAGMPLFLVTAGFLATTLGSEISPELDEGSIRVNASLPPLVSPTEAQLIARRVRQQLHAVPEVAKVVSEVERPDDGMDPKTLNSFEAFVELKREAEWRAA